MVKRNLLRWYPESDCQWGLWPWTNLVIKSGRTTGVTRGKVARIEVNTKLDYRGGVEATISSFEIGIDEANAPPDGEISRGGDSGSAWLGFDGQGQVTGIILGLHFAGEANSEPLPVLDEAPTLEKMEP